MPVLGPICSRPLGNHPSKCKDAWSTVCLENQMFPRSHLALESLVLEVHILEEVHLLMKRFRHLKISPKGLLVLSTELILRSKQPVIQINALHGCTPDKDHNEYLLSKWVTQVILTFSVYIQFSKTFFSHTTFQLLNLGRWGSPNAPHNKFTLITCKTKKWLTRILLKFHN